MAPTPEHLLRRLLGEQIPDGGTEADTMFSDEELSEILIRTDVNGNVNSAAYYGWMEKAAQYANMVNVNEGNAAREMGELYKAALRMADKYIGYVSTPSRGRARIGKIVRARD